MPGTVLGARQAATNKQVQIPALVELIFSGGSKQVNQIVSNHEKCCDLVQMEYCRHIECLLNG